MQTNIQLLRFLAAMSVVLYHTTGHYVAAGGAAGTGWLDFLSRTAYAGVDVFFVISGYIMWTSSRALHNGIASAGGFLYRRFTRIYLGYWPFLLLLLALHFFYGIEHSSRIDFSGSVFLTQRRPGSLLLPVSWTLTYELYFYVCFSILLLLPAALRLPLLRLCLLCVLALMAACILYGHAELHRKARWILKASAFAASPFCAEFIAGCLLAHYLETRRAPSAGACLAVCIVMVSVAVFYQMQDPLGADGLLNYPHRRVALFGPVAVAVVALVAGLEQRGTAPFARAALLLGGASYSLYLAHTIILDGLYLAGLRGALPGTAYWPATFTILALVLILVYSVWHYLFIEKPLMRVARVFAGRVGL